ncbi:hypothetical protein CFL01nite_00170 [Corynebacterium flavescens]|uniref:Uncharacterized protein n=1 Tax=Corynebacterium flavescens TaxID=28028 RepID=A0AB73B4E0_CORFL|nr:hypothetical protein CFL01nite_00170 [Corynebacterium flavescens]
MGGRPARKLSHSVSVGVSFSVRDIYLINPGRLASLKGSAALDSTSYMLRDDWRTKAQFRVTCSIVARDFLVRVEAHFERLRYRR